MSLKIGDKALDFELFNNNLEKTKLSDYIGKKNIVLLFFPLVNTSVCEKELCSFRDSLKQYEELDAQIFAISVDSPFSLKLWNEKQKFNFPLLSDFNKEISKLYGAFYEVFAPGKFDFKGVAKRSAFIIDKQGIIRYIEILENAGEEPNYEKIQEELKKLK
jgi:peroxiredoxin